MEAEQKRIGIGFESYKEMIDKNCYYVDKTLLVRDLLEQGGKVNLFTRPRRFGKTLALSMLQTFFEAATDEKGKVTDCSPYFKGMNIMEAGEKYTRHMGQYPVIKFTLKSAKQPTYSGAYYCLKREIASEFQRHKYVLEGDVLSREAKKLYCRLMDDQGKEKEYATSLQFLSECLYRYHGRNTVILIDEYDVPLENAWFEGFYEKMIKWLRSLFESALKTNSFLEFAVITGCLRISKESIFTGLNNLKIISILSSHFGEYFGFVQKEVETMLNDYGLKEHTEQVRQWYNGYVFGEAEVYNPWSITNYVDNTRWQASYLPRPYWANTSSNSIIKELVEEAGGEAKKEIEKLIAEEMIEKPIHEDITYEDIRKNRDSLWNFLFFTGYLKAVGQRMEEETIYISMKIPNKEVRYIYNQTIREWFQQRIEAMDFTAFYQALLEENSLYVEETVRKQLRESISFMDNGEQFYHGFLLGLLSGLQYYEKLSNRESGDGRPDILLKPYDENQPVIIIEIKRVTKFNQMEAGCERALSQIREKKYAADPIDEGYTKILAYGICFCKKSCKVSSEGDFL